MRTFVDQTAIPDAPGSEDMTPMAMQLESLPDVTEPTEGTVIAPIEMNMENFTMEDLTNKERPNADGPPDSWWREKDLARILAAPTEQEAVKEAERYLTEWFQFTPEEFAEVRKDAGDNGRSYSEEVLGIAASEGGIYRDREIAPHEEAEMKHLDSLIALMNKRPIRKGQQYGQPMANTQTQPPKGVTNMAGGSTGSQGSSPGTEKPTEGGTTGKTPSVAPGTPGVGTPKVNGNPQGQAQTPVTTQQLGNTLTKAVNQESMDNLFDNEEDQLPADDEMLLSEFESLK
jgi:hypothetical protein